MQLKSHYEKMWNSSLKKFKDNAFELDALINSRVDDRYGLTLLTRPSSEVKENIERFLQEVRRQAPNQYFYPPEDIHLTVLSIISCYSGFSLQEINQDLYTKLIAKAVLDVPSFDIHFKGLTASPSCIMVQGFPAGSQLEDLRDSLRTAFKNTDLQHSIDKRYSIQTAHLTVIRFKKPLKFPENFISIVSQYRNADFGSCKINELELVGNNWYQQKEKVKLLKRYRLSADKVE